MQTSMSSSHFFLQSLTVNFPRIFHKIAWHYIAFKTMLLDHWQRGSRLDREAVKMSRPTAARRLRTALREISRKDSSLTAHKIPKTERREPGIFREDITKLYLSQ